MSRCALEFIMYSVTPQYDARARFLSAILHPPTIRRRADVVLRRLAQRLNLKFEPEAARPL